MDERSKWWRVKRTVLHIEILGLMNFSRIKFKYALLAIRILEQQRLETPIELASTGLTVGAKVQN
jgi:hypothetical protein